MAIIDKPTDYFNTVLYSGTGNEQTVSGVGFQPDFTWLKSRTNGQPNTLQNSVTGATKQMHTSSNAGETSYTQLLKSFNSDGFVLGTDSFINQNSQNFVSWNWKEEATLFDIVSFTGNGTARTISHNLGSVPKFMICKDRDNVRNWGTYHQAIGPASDAGYLNNAVVPEANNNFWNNTNPTASVFSVGTDNTYNGNGNDYIVYLFGDSSVSKCGSYIGNGSSNGTFIYTGFKPAFVIYKNTTQADSWFIHDNKRQGYNPENELLFADLTQAESTVNRINLFSNGFRATDSDKGVNASGNLYIYIAFAENPFVTSTSNGSIPALGR